MKNTEEKKRKIQNRNPGKQNEKNGISRYRLRMWMTGFALLGLLTSDLLCALGILILYLTGVLSSMDTTPTILMIVTLVSSTVLGAGMTLLYSMLFLKPLEAFVDATRQVRDGDFSARVTLPDSPFLRNSQVEEFADSFNQMAAELASTELFRKDFISNFSHEFKTPIISIRGFARQLTDENLPREQQSEFARIIVEESEMLADMSSNVLLLTRFEHQEIVSEKTSFSLDEQLRRCMLLFEEQWSALDLSIDMELDEITCYSNEEMLGHVWKNLISNAVKFSKKDGALYVGCHAEQAAVVVTIRDSGVGMDREMQKHIFEKFYQGDPSHAVKGNGLGLSLVQRILFLLGGSIAVDSAPGFGSTFTVTLALEDET